jgi:hypothetical protein
LRVNSHQTLTVGRLLDALPSHRGIIRYWETPDAKSSYTRRNAPDPHGIHFAGRIFL